MGEWLPIFFFSPTRSLTAFSQQSDMQTRAALWQRMTMSNCPSFKLPKQGHLSRAEQNDEDRLYHAVLGAQRRATEEELRTPSRTMRVFVGFKSSSV